MRTVFIMILTALVALPATAKPKKVASALARPWIDEAQNFSVSPGTVVMVDRAKTLTELVTLSGYDSYESEIPDDSAVAPGKGVRYEVCRLVYFRGDNSPAKKMKLLDDLGLRPATVEELFSFSISEPDERMKYNLVGLGTDWETVDGRRYVAMIGSYLEPGTHPDEPDWVLYDYDRRGRLTIVKPVVFTQHTEQKRFVSLVRQDDLWTDEIDGVTVVVAVMKDE